MKVNNTSHSRLPVVGRIAHNRENRLPPPSVPDGSMTPVITRSLSVDYGKISGFYLTAARRDNAQYSLRGSNFAASAMGRSRSRPACGLGTSQAFGRGRNS